MARREIAAGCSGGRAGRKPCAGAGDTPASTFGFTVVELLVVMSIILVLAGLIIATSSYVHKKGASSRAEAEIAAMSAALENYKADNGIYPASPTLDARASGGGDPTQASYKDASLILYQALSGDADNDANRSAELTSYMSFKPNQLAPTDTTKKVDYIKDPFGNCYGYSTINGTDPAKGYNPTFDLWSTAGSTATGTPNPVPWVKNW